MRYSGRRKSAIFFLILGICLVALAAALNVSWVLLNWRKVALLVVGLVFFTAIIVGLILNTTFLLREIRRNEEHDAFINAVTHELKTPIASIRLYLETLKKHDLDLEKRREFYDIMLADSDRLHQTVEQVLRAGQESNRLPSPGNELVDLRALVRDCVALAGRRYPNLPANAFKYSEASVNGVNVYVKGDEEELRAAIGNVIDNAVKYSSGDSEVMLELGPVDDKLVTLSVQDQGVGIPPDKLKRIFGRFYRVPGRTASEVKGTGLGLFIVRSIVRKHGGRITARSAGEGRGSTFIIQLPTAQS